MRNIVKIFLLSSIFLIMVSCGVTNKKAVNPEPPLFNNEAGAITINSAGIVPILGINRPTRTAIFIRNHSNTAVQDIRFNSSNLNENIFTKVLNYITGKPGNSVLKIDAASATSCSTIPANGYCALIITTPSYSKLGNQEGSNLITARYMVNNEIKMFTQIINYQQTEIKGRANISSGLNLNSYGYDISYGTMYIYSGNQNNIIESLRFNLPAVSVVNNDLTGSELEALEVQAIEVSSPAKIVSSIVTMLSVYTKDDGLASSASVTVLPKGIGAILVNSLLPYYDLNGRTSITGNSYSITNVGDESAILGSISSDNSSIIIESNNNTCYTNKILAVGASCNINFNIIPNGSQLVSGNGSITVSYTSLNGKTSTVVNTVNWSDSQKVGRVAMLFDIPINFIRNDGENGLHESFKITFRNMQNIPLSDIAINIRSITGNLTIKSISECANNTLNMESICTVNVNVSDTVVEDHKQFLITFSAKSGVHNYSKIAYGIYSTVTNRPLFVLQAIPSTYQIFGNAKESQSGLILISNNGPTATARGRIDASNFTQFSNLFTVNLGDGKCRLGEILEVGESCVVSIKLNPKNESSPIGESNVAVYTLRTTGLNMGESGITRLNIPFNILPNTQGFKITKVTLDAADSGGDGSINYPFILGGEKIAPTVVITYQNESDNTLKVVGLYESGTSGMFWQQQPFNPVDVKPGESFTIVYNSVLGSIPANYLGNILINPQENIMLPTLYFQDFTLAESSPTPFKQIVSYNGDNYINIRGVLGTLSNTVVVNDPGLITESYVLSSKFNGNNRSYNSAISVNTFVDISNNKLLNKSSNCNNIESTGLTLVSCTLNSSSWDSFASYSVESVYILESSIVFNTYYNRPGYNLNTNGQAIVVDLTGNSVTLPQLKWQEEANLNSIQGNQNILDLAIDNSNNRYILISESGGDYNEMMSLFKESNGAIVPLKRGIAYASFAHMVINPKNNYPYITFTNQGDLNKGYVYRYNTIGNQIESLPILNIIPDTFSPSMVFDADGNLYVAFKTSSGVLVYKYNYNESNLNQWVNILDVNDGTYNLPTLVINPINNLLNMAAYQTGSVFARYYSGTSWNNLDIVENTNSLPSNINFLSDQTGDMFLAYDDTTMNNKLKISFYPGSGYPNSGNWSSLYASQGAVGSINSKITPNGNKLFFTFTDDRSIKVINYIGSPFIHSRFQTFGYVDVTKFADNTLLSSHVVSIDFDKVTNYPIIAYLDPVSSNIKIIYLPINVNI